MLGSAWWNFSLITGVNGTAAQSLGHAVQSGLGRSQDLHALAPEEILSCVDGKGFPGAPADWDKRMGAYRRYVEEPGLDVAQAVAAREHALAPAGGTTLRAALWAQFGDHARAVAETTRNGILIDALNALDALGAYADDGHVIHTLRGTAVLALNMGYPNSLWWEEAVFEATRYPLAYGAAFCFSLLDSSRFNPRLRQDQVVARRDSLVQAARELDARFTLRTTLDLFHNFSIRSPKDQEALREAWACRGRIEALLAEVQRAPQNNPVFRMTRDETNFYRDKLRRLELAVRCHVLMLQKGGEEAFHRSRLEALMKGAHSLSSPESITWNGYYLPMKDREHPSLVLLWGEHKAASDIFRLASARGQGILTVSSKEALTAERERAWVAFFIQDIAEQHGVPYDAVEIRVVRPSDPLPFPAKGQEETVDFLDNVLPGIHQALSKIRDPKRD